MKENNIINRLNVITIKTIKSDDKVLKEYSPLRYTSEGPRKFISNGLTERKEKIKPDIFNRTMGKMSFQNIFKNKKEKTNMHLAWEIKNNKLDNISGLNDFKQCYNKKKSNFNSTQNSFSPPKFKNKQLTSINSKKSNSLLFSQSSNSMQTSQLNLKENKNRSLILNDENNHLHSRSPSPTPLPLLCPSPSLMSLTSMTSRNNILIFSDLQKKNQNLNKSLILDKLKNQQQSHLIKKKVPLSQFMTNSKKKITLEFEEEDKQTLNEEEFNLNEKDYFYNKSKLSKNSMIKTMYFISEKSSIYSKILPNNINSKKENEIVKSSCGKSKSGIIQDGSKKINQDSHLIKHNVLDLDNYSIYCVFDGHGINKILNI